MEGAKEDDGSRLSRRGSNELNEFPLPENFPRSFCYPYQPLLSLSSAIVSFYVG